jgi:hypothetical protein
MKEKRKKKKWGQQGQSQALSATGCIYCESVIERRGVTEYRFLFFFVVFFMGMSDSSPSLVISTLSLCCTLPNPTFFVWLTFCCVEHNECDVQCTHPRHRPQELISQKNLLGFRPWLSRSYTVPPSYNKQKKDKAKLTVSPDPRSSTAITWNPRLTRWRIW